MELTLLGTGAAEGWPGIFCQCDNCRRARELGGKNIRTRSSLLIDGSYKIDFPPDTYHHVLQNNLDLGKLEHLLITHAHQDHFCPDELFMRKEPFAHLRHQHQLHVYGDQWVMEAMEATNRDWESAGIATHLLKPYEDYTVGAMQVTPLQAVHFPERGALNYVFTLDGKTVLYGMDSGMYREETWAELSRFKLEAAFIDCTMGGQPDADVHTGVEGVRAIKERLIAQGSADESTQFIATHFSHNGGLLHEELETNLLPANIAAGFDGMVVRL